MTDETLGLALGGGGALGAAHVGVLRAIHERGLHPSIVAGTSAGALVGAAYAAGIPIRRIERLVLTASWSTFGRLSPSPRLGLLDSSALLDTIDRLGGEPRIEDLPRRFAAVATDPRARKEVILDRGPLGTALRASIAVPGLFGPVVEGGRILLDGGIMANLPIRAAYELGATSVIAVRLRPEWERFNLVPTAASIAAMEGDPHVVTIRPALAGMSQWSASDLTRLIDAGYEAACAALDASDLEGVRRAS